MRASSLHAGDYLRDGAWSYQAHRRIFDAHPAPKVAFSTVLHEEPMGRWPAS